MPQFRKKPVVIEARQLGNDYDEDLAIMKWCGGEWCEYTKADALFTVPTLEGRFTAYVDDWIIKGVKGDFYPCDARVFAATYEPVDLGGAPEGPA